MSGCERTPAHCDGGHCVDAELTLEQKVSLCSGRDFWYTQPVERLGIPSVMVTDGPHGADRRGSA